MGFWDQLTELLSQHEADPVVYLLIFFLFCILATIILPIPIEIMLVVNPSVPFPLKAIVMGLGKGAGAVAVFYIGSALEAVLKMSRWGWFKWLLDKSEAFVRRFGTIALYVIMSIPFMIDTIPLYLFSILNKEGHFMTLRDFTIANMLAGVNRALLVYMLFFVLGAKHLFS
jgi:membrane protein YqaA with SNARE-associated domain